MGDTFLELVILLALAFLIILVKSKDNSNVKSGKGIDSLNKNINNLQQKYAAYSFSEVKKKMQEFGYNYTSRQYIVQCALIGGFAAVIGYLYFVSVIWAIIYGGIAVSFVPFLAYLQSKKKYSDFIFEQIQTYTTNVIMEFNTTQSFVKSLEGVYESGIIEDPVKSDIKVMIDMSYQNGTIDESIAYFNNRYPFYMVKNMHQLFLQITKEGAKDSGQALENMSMDIDSLVEGVYRDQMDRKASHRKFLTFGGALFFLPVAFQFMLGMDSYQTKLLNLWYVQIILHAIIIINGFFMLKGETFFNEDVGVE